MRDRQREIAGHLNVSGVEDPDAVFARRRRGRGEDNVERRRGGCSLLVQVNVAASQNPIVIPIVRVLTGRQRGNRHIDVARVDNGEGKRHRAASFHRAAERRRLQFVDGRGWSRLGGRCEPPQAIRPRRVIKTATTVRRQALSCGSPEMEKGNGGRGRWATRVPHVWIGVTRKTT